MRRWSSVLLLVVTLLTVLMPFEPARCRTGAATASAHCTCAAKRAMAADHSCCRGKAAESPRAAHHACACSLDAAAPVPAAAIVTAPEAGDALVATLAPGATLELHAPRLAPCAPCDVGGPPGPADATAIRGRAPPVSA